MKYALLPLSAFAALCTVVVAEGVPSFTVSRSLARILRRHVQISHLVSVSLAHFC